MNVFRQMIHDLGLTYESQGSGNENSWLYMLLGTMGDSQDANPVEPTFTNPVKQISYQLRNYLNTFAGQRLSQILDRMQYRYPA
jgi:hypothetical protein